MSRPDQRSERKLRVTGGRTGSHDPGIGSLQTALRGAIGGEVRFDAASKGLYATDASNYRQVPIGVVIPRSTDDVVAAHRVCHEHQAPLLPRGAGTSLSGEAVNEAVVIDHSKYRHRVIDVDPARRLVTVESGCINQQVNEHVARHGLVFGPDPSTHRYCTIGGNVGNNSCGIHSVQAEFYGDGARTSDNVHSLDILTYDGVRMTVGPTSDEAYERIVAAGGRRAEIYRGLRELRDRYETAIRERFPKIPRRVSGYNLDDLLPERGFNVAAALSGTEGTCATILSATLKLVPLFPGRKLLVVGYEDIAQAARHVLDVRDHRPIGIEGIDHQLFTNEQRVALRPDQLSQMPDGDAWLLVEFGADSPRDAELMARALAERLQRDHRPPVDATIFDDPVQEKLLWKIREAGLAATARPSGGDVHWPGWEDSAVPPEHMTSYITDLRQLYERYGYTGVMYGHFGQGCLHSRINFDLKSDAGIERYRRFMEDAADLCISYGGSLSGEHGDGQQRAELLPRMFGDELIGAFREFKSIWDPDGKMNPGKIVDPFRLDENLKLGRDHDPLHPKTTFAYPDDAHDFAQAALRCVGVGKCRIPSGAGVMCPSYMVTREEKHTTRGRAHLLFEMIQGEVITDGWRSKEVFDALDLCLSCKGCTNECPVNVDIPTYKAEFLHHHWKRRFRPRRAYAFGLIDKTAWLASKMPRVANAAASTAGLKHAIRWIAGATGEREIPSFATVPLREWFHNRGDRNIGGPRVIVFPDTFNNYFHADVGRSAVEAIEDAGWHVVMPDVHLCCGRPLYDFGMLHLAGQYLRRVVDTLRDEIRAGTPMIGLEPSCLATFKDEMLKLIPHDDDARRLAQQALHFSEFYRRYDITPPQLNRRAVLWGHCHQKATGGMVSEHELLEKMGMSFYEVNGGCCGLAGSWGFDPDHQEISLACGEEALFPAVREADVATMIVANGFSCQTQISQGGTGRQALHVAELMAMARTYGAAGPSHRPPEKDPAPEDPAPAASDRKWSVTLAVGTAAAVAIAAARRHRRMKDRTDAQDGS